MQILRLQQLRARLGISRSSVYELLRGDHTFPRPVRLGKRVVGWIDDEIDEWLKSRPRAAEARAGAVEEAYP